MRKQEWVEQTMKRIQLAKGTGTLNGHEEGFLGDIYDKLAKSGTRPC